MELGRHKFKKRRFPETSYVEYDVVDLLTENCPGNGQLSTTLEDEISNSRRLSKKRPSSEEKNYENLPGISKLVNLSGDKESEWEGQAESHPKVGSSKVAKRIYGTATKDRFHQLPMAQALFTQEIPK